MHHSLPSLLTTVLFCSLQSLGLTDSPGLQIPPLVIFSGDALTDPEQDALNGAIQQFVRDSSGNVYVAGEFSGVLRTESLEISNEHSSPAIFISRLDAINHSAVWLRDFSSEFAFQGLIPHPDGGVAVLTLFRGPLATDIAGIPFTASARWGVVVVRLNEAGEPGLATVISTDRLNVSLAGGAEIAPFAIAQALYDNEGNLIIAGNFQEQLDVAGVHLTSENSVRDINWFAAKIGSAGELHWLHQGGSTWVDELYDTAVDAAGNVFITVGFGGGTSTLQSHTWTAPFSDGDGLVFKFSADGELAWGRQASFAVQGNQRDFEYVRPDGQGGCYVLGRYSLLSSAQPFAAHYDSLGNQTWIRAIERVEPLTLSAPRVLGLMESDASGNVYIAAEASTSVRIGEFLSSGSTGTDVFVVKLDSSGQPVWLRQIASPQVETLHEFEVDASGNSYVLGEFESELTLGEFSVISRGTTDAFLSKLDSEGETQWMLAIGGPGSDSTSGVLPDGSGGVWLSGGFSGESYIADLPIGGPDGNNSYLARVIEDPGLVAIELSNQTVRARLPAGTIVGNFRIISGDADETHTVALVTGSGDNDNGFFTIEGEELRTSSVFDFGDRDVYRIRVRATNTRGSAIESAFNIQILPPPPTLAALSPTGIQANGSDYTMRITGGPFLEGATVYWNGHARLTSVATLTELSAVIPGTDLIISGTIAVAVVHVVNGDGQISNPRGFGIIAESVGLIETSVLSPGEMAEIAAGANSPGQAGVRVSAQNASGQTITLAVATYIEQPTDGTLFRVNNGAFVDVQISGATEDVSANVLFSYPSTVAETESDLRLRYFDGVKWSPVLSSGGLPPAKDTTDNLAGTISGGRFTVIFDATSTPTIMELTGTVFGMFQSQPQLQAITGPVDPVELGNEIAVSVEFAAIGDPNAVDVHFLWDDGTASVVEPVVPGIATATHVYQMPGVYGVTVRVVDAEGDQREGRFEYVVVYDPNGGFVTGGGWLHSPAGAYVFDPTLTGKASFGFVSKHKKGQSVPTGETELQFQAGDFRFRSTAYQWLVVAGAKAQYKGVGTVNGTGDYGFLLTATDGQVNGGGGVDKFRIKIWDQPTGVTVYDNVLGASDDMDAASPQVIGGGSIVIHSGK